MLTREMIAEEILGKASSWNNSIKKTQEWCRQCEAFEKAFGRDVITSRWNIQCDIKITKQELPVLRKIVGRLTMDSKSLSCSTPGKEMVDVAMKAKSSDWDALRFTYTVRYRAGKCKIVEQHISSYKTLVCSV